MKKIFLFGAAALLMAGCGDGNQKYSSATSASHAFLNSCVYTSIDYQITGDNASKTFTVTCKVGSNYQ